MFRNRLVEAYGHWMGLMRFTNLLETSSENRHVTKDQASPFVDVSSFETIQDFGLCCPFSWLETRWRWRGLLSSLSAAKNLHFSLNSLGFALISILGRIEGPWQHCLQFFWWWYRQGDRCSGCESTDRVHSKDCVLYLTNMSFLSVGVYQLGRFLLLNHLLLEKLCGVSKNVQDVGHRCSCMQDLDWEWIPETTWHKPVGICILNKRVKHMQPSNISYSRPVDFASRKYSLQPVWVIHISVGCHQKKDFIFRGSC